MTVPIFSGGYAFSILQNCTIRKTLTPEEYQSLVRRVQLNHPVSAGDASRVLARCVSLPVADRIEVIKERFKKELISPSPIGSIRDTYLSPRVYVLNPFLLAFSYIGKPGIPYLMQEKNKTVENEEIKKWWILALGFAEDDSVAEDLKRIIQNDTDKSMQCIAIRAYARSARQAAIPLLEKLQEGYTPGKEPPSLQGHMKYLVEITAKEELFELQEQNVQDGKK